MTERNQAQNTPEKPRKAKSHLGLALFLFGLMATGAYLISQDKCRNLPAQETIPVEVFQQCRRTTFISPYSDGFYRVEVAPIAGGPALADSLDRTDEANAKLINKLGDGTRKVRHVIIIQVSDHLGFELDNKPTSVLDEKVVTTIFHTPEEVADELAQDALFSAVVESAAMGPSWDQQKAQDALNLRTREIMEQGEAPFNLESSKTALSPQQIAGVLEK